MLGQDVLLEDPAGIAVELEHGGVELQDVLGADLGGGCRLDADNPLELGRHLRGARRRARSDADKRQRAKPACHDRNDLH